MAGKAGRGKTCSLFHDNHFAPKPHGLPQLTIPGFINNKPIPDRGARGWILSQTFTARSGLPYTVVDGTRANVFTSKYTPVQALGPPQQNCSSGLSQCFNGNEFVSANGLAAFPTQTRNQYRGPAFFNADLSVGKNFQLTENVKFMVGANTYNVFNHLNFQNPSGLYTPGCVTSADCGQITNMTAPPTGPYGSFYPGLPAGRVGQIQGKITF